MDMHYIFLAVIILLPSPSLSLVDCIIACTRCHGHEEEYPGILEVYCAMCHECNDRRRKLTLRDNSEREQLIYNLENHAEDCPTPPPCESDTEDVPPYTLANNIPPTTTPSSTTSSTTTRRPCPVVAGCKKAPTSRPRCYYPCVPACPCPYPQLYTSVVPHKLAGSTTTGKSTGFLYVYVGVPRDTLQKISR